MKSAAVLPALFLAALAAGAEDGKGLPPGRAGGGSLSGQSGEDCEPRTWTRSRGLGQNAQRTAQVSSAA